jgi:hypothetical protein
MSRYFLSFTLILMSVASAQERSNIEPATDKDAELTELFRNQASEMMTEYEFTLPERTEVDVEFRARPIMTWTNPIAGSWEGIVFIWTAEGRPAVIGSPLHRRERRKMAHHFHSLLDTPLIARRDGIVVWNTQGGVKWQPLPNADPPKTSKVARTVQMRSYARRFAVKKVFQDATQRELRLLPTHVFRSEIDQGQEVVDGACFVFTQSTDPNVVLLFEARRDENALRWYYALARLNQFELIVSCDEVEVYRFPFIPFPERSNRLAPYTKFFNQLYRDDPGPQSDVPAASSVP